MVGSMTTAIQPSTSCESTEQSAWQLIARRLAGEASECDLKRLRELLKEDADLSHSVQVLYTIWEKPVNQDRSADKARALLIHKIKQRCISLEN